MEGDDDRRRHRVDQAVGAWKISGDQSRSGLLRRRAGNIVRVESERDGNAARERDLHERRAHGRQRRLVGGHDEDTARTPDRLAGQIMDARMRQARCAPECAVHGFGDAVSVARCAVGQPGGRAAVRAGVRRAQVGHGAAGVGGAQLGRGCL